MNAWSDWPATPREDCPDTLYGHEASRLPGEAILALVALAPALWAIWWLLGGGR